MHRENSQIWFSIIEPTKPSKQEVKAERTTKTKNISPPVAEPLEPQAMDVDVTPQPRRTVTEDDASGIARPARARKSINYAEPKLNTLVNPNPHHPHSHVDC